jgi:RNA 2',3'-cyclic 3'-phosphodiesterase
MPLASLPTPPAPTDPARLFLALWPDAVTCRAIQPWQAALRWPAGARLTPPAHWHLTLHFIGSVPRDRLPELAQGLVRPFTPFDLVLDGFEGWHHGVAVLCPAETPPALSALQISLAEALEALNLPVETRPFRPHLTLARHAAGATLIEGHTPPPVHWPARDGYVLAESAGGYRVLRRFGDRVPESAAPDRPTTGRTP